MNRSGRKRQFDDDQATSSNKSTRRSYDEAEVSSKLANNPSITGFLNQKSKYEYDSKKEHLFVSLFEQVDWMHNTHTEMISELNYPESTFEQLDLEEQCDFVDRDVYCDILHCKSRLNEFDKNTLRIAKSSSNPFELINKCIFQNRSALKMAELDYLCVTQPKPPLIDECKDIYYFADICGGPGGFTEYCAWKKKWTAKGFGITLKAENDFNLEKLPSASIFTPFYGDLEDGDICRPQNLLSFRNYVLNNTSDKHGVHASFADGAFSCKGKESQQELLMKRLILCQFVCSLSILRKGGHFMCKLFDVYSEFVVGLIYLMYMCFEQFTILKPNTSRPANSERYIVFKSKLDNCEYIENFLFKINCSLDSFELAAHPSDLTASPVALKEDFHKLIPLETIKADSAFYNYIRYSNNKLGRRQTHFLCKERAFAIDSTLVDNQKNNLRHKCLSQLKIPTRTQLPASVSMTAEQKFESLMNEHSINISQCAFLYYDLNEIKQLNAVWKYPWNFSFTTLTENRDNDSQRGIFLAYANTAYFFNTTSSKWQKVKVERLKLPDDTLVYGALTSVYKGEGTSQKKITAFHIIDGCILGGVNVCRRILDERVAMADKMIKALSLQNANNFFIQVKKYFPLPMIDDYVCSSK